MYFARLLVILQKELHIFNMSASYEYSELERLFEGNPLIQATLEQACDFSGKDSVSANAESIFRDKQSLLGHVVQRAKELGTWIEKIEDYVKEMIGNGQENDVFISSDDYYAIKLNNFEGRKR